MKNAIEDLRDYVASRHPSARTEIYPALRPEGYWALDVDLAGTAGLAVEWNETKGFILSTRRGVETLFGGADERHPTLDEAKARVSRLLTTGETTVRAVAGSA